MRTSLYVTKSRKFTLVLSVLLFLECSRTLALFLNAKMNRQDLRNFEDAITIVCTFTLDRVRERNHLLAQMIWQNNFSEKKSFFFRFNQNCKILISCPFFTISNGQTDLTFYTQKRIFLENWLPCIRICLVGNKMHVLSR